MRKLGFGKWNIRNPIQVVTRCNSLGSSTTGTNIAYTVGPTGFRGWALVTGSTGSINIQTPRQDMELSFSLNNIYANFGGPGQPGNITLPNININEIQAMFDQYRIKKIECTFIHSVNTHTGENPGKDNLGQFYIVKDYDDAAAVTVTDLMQYGDVKRWTPMGDNIMKTIVIKPKPLLTALNSVAGSAYAISNDDMWMPTQSADIPHYGIKLAYDLIGPQQTQTTVSGTTTVDPVRIVSFVGIQFKYHIEVRMLK